MVRVLVLVPGGGFSGGADVFGVGYLVPVDPNPV